MLTGNPLEILHKIVMNAYDASVNYAHFTNSVYYNNNTTSQDLLLLESGCEYKILLLNTSKYSKDSIQQNIQRVLSKYYTGKPCFCYPKYIFNKYCLLVNNYTKKMSSFQSFIGKSVVFNFDTLYTDELMTNFKNRICEDYNDFSFLRFFEILKHFLNNTNDGHQYLFFDYKVFKI